VLRRKLKIPFFVMARLDPRLSGSAFCCSFTKAPKTPAQPLAGLVPAIHVFERGSANGREGVDAHGSSPWAEGPRAKPGQGDLGGGWEEEQCLELTRQRRSAPAGAGKALQ
jgi:hypothetical protein